MQTRVGNHLLGASTSSSRSSRPSSTTSLFRTPSSHSSMLWFTCSVSYRNLSASLGLTKESWMPMQIATSYFGCKAAFQMCHVESNSKEAGKETRACFRRESGRQISNLSLSWSVWHKLRQQQSFNPGRQVFEMFLLLCRCVCGDDPHIGKESFVSEELNDLYFHLWLHLLKNILNEIQLHLDFMFEIKHVQHKIRWSKQCPILFLMTCFFHTDQYLESLTLLIFTITLKIFTPFELFLKSL